MLGGRDKSVYVCGGGFGELLLSWILRWILRYKGSGRIWGRRNKCGLVYSSGGLFVMFKEFGFNKS